jgi:hypothetical protein
MAWVTAFSSFLPLSRPRHPSGMRRLQSRVTKLSEPRGDSCYWSQRRKVRIDILVATEIHYSLRSFNVGHDFSVRKVSG